jgi:flagellar protein FliO/FliZ
MKLLMPLRGAVLVGALTLLHAPIALAAGGSDNDFGQNAPLHLSPTTTAAHTSSGTGASIVRTIVGLAIVIAVIYGLSWILRQAKAAKNPTRGTGLEQIASLPLGTNRSVALVRVGSELHLLGVGEHGVTGIKTFTEDEAVAAGLPLDDYGDDEVVGDPPLVRAIDALRRMTVR